MTYIVLMSEAYEIVRGSGTSSSQQANAGKSIGNLHGKYIWCVCAKPLQHFICKLLLKGGKGFNKLKEPLIQQLQSQMSSEAIQQVIGKQTFATKQQETDQQVCAPDPRTICCFFDIVNEFVNKLNKNNLLVHLLICDCIKLGCYTKRDTW